MNQSPNALDAALQSFMTTDDVVSYIVAELLATLRDDLAENESNPGEADTCADLAAKIADIELVEPLLHAADPLVKALAALNDECWLDTNPCDTDDLAKAKVLARAALKGATS